MNHSVQEIWKVYHHRLHAFILSRVKEPTVADDILQNVFIKIHSNIASLKENNKIQSWIYSVTRNSIIDYFRSHRKMEELPDNLSDSKKNSSENALKEISQCLEPMIQNLSRPYRKIIELSEFRNMGLKKVAENQKISLSNVKVRVHRGRKMLKDLLLQCCHFEFDRRGRIIDYKNKGCECKGCNK